MVGGNHLVALLPDNHPPVGTNHDEARSAIGYGQYYEVWCCWDAIIRARKIVDDVVATI